MAPNRSNSRRRNRSATAQTHLALESKHELETERRSSVSWAIAFSGEGETAG